jgi:hypothetical protein
MVTNPSYLLAVSLETVAHPRTGQKLAAPNIVMGDGARAHM